MADDDPMDLDGVAPPRPHRPRGHGRRMSRSPVKRQAQPVYPESPSTSSSSTLSFKSTPAHHKRRDSASSIPWLTPLPASPTKSSGQWSFNSPDTPTTSSWFNSRDSRSRSPVKGGNSFSNGDASPTRRKRQPTLRLNENEASIDPSSIVGKTLRRVHRGASHPNLTLVFTDGTAVQVLIDGYNPQAPGVPKALEMDPTLEQALPTDGRNLELLVTDCALVKLTDKAYDAASSGAEVQRWDQDHMGIAFKFAGMSASWMACWAVVNDDDGKFGTSTFRTYEDVYLKPLDPRRSRPRKQSSSEHYAD